MPSACVRPAHAMLYVQCFPSQAHTPNAASRSNLSIFVAQSGEQTTMRPSPALNVLVDEARRPCALPFCRGKKGEAQQSFSHTQGLATVGRRSPCPHTIARLPAPVSDEPSAGSAGFAAPAPGPKKACYKCGRRCITINASHSRLPPRSRPPLSIPLYPSLSLSIPLRRVNRYYMQTRPQLFTPRPPTGECCDPRCVLTNEATYPSPPGVGARAGCAARGGSRAGVARRPPVRFQVTETSGYGRSGIAMLPNGFSGQLGSCTARRARGAGSEACTPRPAAQAGARGARGARGASAASIASPSASSAGTRRRRTKPST